jgi:hypothetical protein
MLACYQVMLKKKKKKWYLSPQTPLLHLIQSFDRLTHHCLYSGNNNPDDAPKILERVLLLKVI